jgi:hypothetical protein
VRKLLSIALTLILFANIFGYFISFTVQRCNIKAEVAELLSTNGTKQAVQLVLTQEEYSRLIKSDDDKEFTLNGNLYDIARKELKNGNILLAVYCDTKETGLVGNLISFITDNNKAEKSKHTLPLFSLLEFVFHAEEWKSYDNSMQLSLPAFSDRLLTLILDTDSPPPDLS